jgi:DNA (cytosine-5)-methyltransferase 1
MSAYYNEHDKFCADWLRNLISAGHIAPGDVDERSIVDVRPGDLRGHTQCHFFAGIGVWSAALRAEGWSDDREIWTGSCPCQPLSGAGQRKGHLDERHLWPAFHALIAECRPATVVGEQVDGTDGREWIAAVRADLEATGYSVGIAGLCAAGARAAHIRQRLYWVADASSEDKSGRGICRPSESNSAGDGAACERSEGLCASGWDWIACSDGKARPTQPGLQPLVDAWPAGNRVALLRAAGNALEIGTARQFIRAVRELP